MVLLFCVVTQLKFVFSSYTEQLMSFLNKQLARIFAYIVSLLTGYPSFRLRGQELLAS
jgi:hypothetical protein